MEIHNDEKEKKTLNDSNESKKKRKLSRRQLREEVFKIIFGLEFDQKFKITKDLENNLDLNKDNNESDVSRNMIETNNLLENYFEENGFSKDEEKYVRDIIYIYVEKRDEILANISKYLKNTWTLSRISKVSIAIIQIAIIEIMYLDLDYKIAINEAVEISKKYQDEKETKFVNGILSNFVNISKNNKSDKNNDTNDTNNMIDEIIND